MWGESMIFGSSDNTTEIVYKSHLPRLRNSHRGVEIKAKVALVTRLSFNPPNYLLQGVYLSLLSEAEALHGSHAALDGGTSGKGSATTWAAAPSEWLCHCQELPTRLPLRTPCLLMTGP